MKNSTKSERKAKQKAKRIARLEEKGEMVLGIPIPKGAIPANPDDQALPGTYSVKLYYTDTEFVCRGCGGKFVWTDSQQKRYFEDQKGNPYNEATWCTPCHKKRNNSNTKENKSS